MHLAQHTIVIYFILRSEFSQGGKQQAGEQKQSDINNLANTTNRVVFPVAFTTGHLFHSFEIIASLYFGVTPEQVVLQEGFQIRICDMKYTPVIKQC